MNQDKYYLLTSISGHMLLLLAIAVYFLNKPVLIRNEKLSAIENVYTITSSSPPSQLSERFNYNRPESGGKSAENHTFDHRAPNHVARSINSHTSNTHKEQTSLAKENVLRLLHTAIATHQTYPAESIELNEQGRVKLGFYLAPNGQLTNVSILKASRYASLNEAALSAVTTASPITSAGKYLSAKEFFTIEIVYA